MAIRFGSDEVPKTSPRTLDQEYAASIKPGPFQIGPDQEEVTEFIFSNLLKAANDTYQNANILGLSPETINEDILQPTYDKIKFAKEYWRDVVEDMKLGEMQDEDEYNVLKTFLAESGSDLLDAFVPESNLDLAMEVGEELVPYAKLFAFIPPGMLRRLTKAIDAGDLKRVATKLAETSPPIRKLIELADGDTSILEPLVRAARREPHVTVHASPVRFTGDEIDLSHAGSGAGGDMMGQGLYRTQRASGVDSGYAYDFDIQAASSSKDWPDYMARATEEAREAAAQRVAAETRKKNLPDDEIVEIIMEGETTHADITKRAVELWKLDNPEGGGKILEFTSQPGTTPYITDQTRLTPVQKQAMFNDMPLVLAEIGFEPDEIAEIMAKVKRGGTEGRPTMKNPTGMIGKTDTDPDEFMTFMSEVIRKKYPAAKGTVGKDFLNRLRMDIGYDEFEYPSGQIYTQAQGHRNYLTTRPEIHTSKPIGEPRIGRQPMAGEGDLSYRNFKEALDAANVAEKELYKRAINTTGISGRDMGEHFMDWSVGEAFIRDYEPDSINLGEDYIREVLGKHGHEARFDQLVADLEAGDVSKDTLLMEWDNYYDDIIRQEADADDAIPGLWKEYKSVRGQMDALERDLARTFGNSPEGALVSRMVRGQDATPVRPEPERPRTPETDEFLETLRESLEEVYGEGTEGLPFTESGIETPWNPLSVAKNPATNPAHQVYLEALTQGMDEDRALALARQYDKNFDAHSTAGLPFTESEIELGSGPKAPKAKVTREKFLETGDLQRGAPEAAMSDVTHQMGGGVMQPALEHVGDIIHRMSDSNTFDASGGFEFVDEKVKKTLRWLKHKYGFEREFMENLRGNFKFYQAEGWPRGKRTYNTYEEFEKGIFELMQKYADEHKKLPVYNRAQELAQQAAVSLGERRFDDAIAALEELDSHLGSRQDWMKFVKEGVE